MIEDIKIQALKAPFSKWIVMDKGVHLMPEQYTPESKNIRIKNATTTKRKWYVRVVSSNDSDHFIDNMISNGDDLFALSDNKLYKVDFNSELTMTRYTNLTFDDDVSLLRYWKYLFFLSENTAKGYYLDTSTGTWWALTITDNAYFRFGEIYKQQVYLAWWGDKSNVLYGSRSWSYASPSNILDFDWDGSQALYFPTKIMGLAAIREQLFVFTENTIEILQQSSAEWGIIADYSIPIAWSNQPVNPKMVVKADDLVFFRTKENQMKSLNYMQWVTETVVWDVSHRQNLSIVDFIDTLDEDQSTSFWYYNRNEKTVHWHLKQKWEPMPNIVLVYDVSTDSFFIDTNKYFRCVAEHNNKYYAGSSFGAIIYEDNNWPVDDWVAVERMRKTALLSVWSPVYRKEFRQVNIYWEKDDDVDIMVTVLVDWQTAFNWTIQASGWGISWMASTQIWESQVAFDTKPWWFKPFEYVITRWNLRARWKNIQIVFNGTSNWDFCLSWIEIGYKDLYDTKGSDRAKPNK